MRFKKTFRRIVLSKKKKKSELRKKERREEVGWLLTLHAQAVGAVLGLEHHALAVLAAVFRSRRTALSPPPVGALCPTC